MIQPLLATQNSNTSIEANSASQRYAAVLNSASTMPKDELVQKLLVLRTVVAKQAQVAGSAKSSEVVATGTGLWEMAWGAFESLAEGIISPAGGMAKMGLLASKLAYTLTSAEEFASSAYLVGNHDKYKKYLLRQVHNIDSLVNKIKDNNTQKVTSEETGLLIASITGDYKTVLSTKNNHDANKVIAGMQVFNFLALGALSVATMFNKDKSTLVNLPKSWIEPVQKVDNIKVKLFENIAHGIGIRNKAKKATAGKFIEAASISVPMAVLALYKFYLSSQSQDKTFSNTLTAQAMSHVACFVGGASNAYHALFIGRDTANWAKWENFLTWYEAGTYFASSGKLLHYIVNNKFTDTLGLTNSQAD